MAKVLNELPGQSRKPSSPLKAPRGPSKPNPAQTQGDLRPPIPKALDRPLGRSGMNQYSEWMMRRCDAFGIASSKYFRKRDRPAGSLKKDT